MAAPRRVIEISIGAEELAWLGRSRGRERSRQAGLSGRGCCWPIARTRRRRRWAGNRGDASYRAALPSPRAFGSGRWRRSRTARGPARRRDHAGSARVAGVAGLPEGQGTGLSARTLDDAAAGAPRPRACGGGRTSLPGGISFRARSAKSSRAMRSSRTRSATISNGATRRSRRRWPRCSASIARSPCCERARSRDQRGDHLVRREAGHPGDRQHRARPAAAAGIASDVRARSRIQAPRHAQPAGRHRPAHRPRACLRRGAPPLARVRRLPQAARCRLSGGHRHQADPRQSLGAHLQGDEGLDRSQPEGRFSFVFTPKHGSWLNLVEGFFSKMARSMLRHIRVASKAELKARILAYLDDLNRDPVVHTWTYKIAEAA